MVEGCNLKTVFWEKNGIPRTTLRVLLPDQTKGVFGLWQEESKDGIEEYRTGCMSSL
jgi:hypothetical protein